MKSILFTATLMLALCAGFAEAASTIKDGGGEGRIPSPVLASDYVVFAWNDLGMHCLNPSYDEAVILPPYNTLVAQVVKRGANPQRITSGITAEYRILRNTYSYGKRSYGQFWTYVKQLFGVELTTDTGLNLTDSTIHNGLSGQMTAKSGYFIAEGIPVTPVDDADRWDPYQVAEITIKNSQGAVLAQTTATVPTSDEINCAKCHGSEPFANILSKHDSKHGTNLQNQKPVLCATCHGSPALGQSGAGSSGKYLSQAIHSSHSSKGAACYDCHPGQITKCSRSVKHTSDTGGCITCHGDMATVASAITSGTRIPWKNEPKCATCHGTVSGVDTGDTLFKNAKGHGGMFCSSCHGSPHAMIPSSKSSDNYQALQYQGAVNVIGSCGVCHNSSRGGGGGDAMYHQSDDDGGGGDDDFYGKHGGANPRVATACNVCHTSVTASTGSWPHAYTWKSRSESSAKGIALTLVSPSSATVSRGGVVGPFYVTIANKGQKSAKISPVSVNTKPDGTLELVSAGQDTLAAGASRTITSFISAGSSASAGNWTHTISVYDSSKRLLTSDSFGYTVSESSDKSAGVSRVSYDSYKGIPGASVSSSGEVETLSVTGDLFAR